MKRIKKSISLGGRELTLETGYLASQATGSILATYGETVVLAVVVASPLKDDPGYFPLNVNYQEKLYAGGRIKGSRWVKRDGRPTDDEVLIGRLIDRSIRPLFPIGYKKDVQITIKVLSVDLESSPDIVSAIATFAAIEASDIPWEGPVAAIKIGLKDEKFIVNPTLEDTNEELDLTVSATTDSIVMIEAGALELPEKRMLEAIEFAEKETAPVLKLIKDFAKEVGITKPKFITEKTDSATVNEIGKLVKKDIDSVLTKFSNKEIGYSEFSEYKQSILELFPEEKKDQASMAFEEVVQGIIRTKILSDKRPDGRKSTDVRKLLGEVSVLPRTHGSGLFMRGQTQVLSVATLGSSAMEQIIESAQGEEKKRYIHHYTMPPFSVGETGRVGFTNRREIGHGALAEKALMPVLPTPEEFPYTIQVVSEVLSSNGSTSMASVCGSTLSMMDAGVPIKAAVAGIAMGVVIKDEKNYKVLSDITGLEDGNGDMDFKVAGTKKGITALQLDVKTLKLTKKILSEAINQARDVREKILLVLDKTISKPRKNLSKYAPKIQRVGIPPEKIGELIGPGGKTIKKIMAETETQIDVDDDGNVDISTTSDENMAAAVSWVESLVKEVQPGEIYKGEVKRIENYGAFVEVLPGKDGLVHVSSMSEEFVKDPNTIVSIGDTVQVRVKKIDEMGRIDLSMILDPSKEKSNEPRNQGQGGGGRFGRRDFGGRGPRRDNRGPRQNSRNSGGGFRSDSSGPHFPASRLMDQQDKKR